MTTARAILNLTVLGLALVALSLTIFLTVERILDQHRSTTIHNVVNVPEGCYR